jgi:hypothetical protein
MATDTWTVFIGSPDGKQEILKAIAEVDDDDEQLDELVDWLRTQTWSEFAQSLVEFHGKRNFLSPKQIAAATKMRDTIVEHAKTPRVKVTQDGMYRHPDGTIYKVQKAVHGSGHLYAKRLVVPDDPAMDGFFEMARGDIMRLTPEMRMGLEQAQAFGSLYGVCCACGRTLTDEGSIAEGIGPVCRTKDLWA